MKIRKMAKELTANGYVFDQFHNGIHVVLQVYTPDLLWQYRTELDGFRDDEKPKTLVRIAYEHLCKERKTITMEAAISDALHALRNGKIAAAVSILDLTNWAKP